MIYSQIYIFYNILETLLPKLTPVFGTKPRDKNLFLPWNSGVLEKIGAKRERERDLRMCWETPLQKLLFLYLGLVSNINIYKTNNPHFAWFLAISPKFSEITECLAQWHCLLPSADYFGLTDRQTDMSDKHYIRNSFNNPEYGMHFLFVANETAIKFFLF